MLTCPYCQCTEIKKSISAFIEMGAYTDNKGYAIEGDAETCICTSCNEAFWVNGPTVDIVYVALMDGKMLMNFHTSEEARHYLGNVLYVAGEATDKPEEEYAKRADEVRTYGSANFNGITYTVEARNRMDA